MTMSFQTGSSFSSTEYFLDRFTDWSYVKLLLLFPTLSCYIFMEHHWFVQWIDMSRDIFWQNVALVSMYPLIYSINYPPFVFLKKVSYSCMPKSGNDLRSSKAPKIWWPPSTVIYSHTWDMSFSVSTPHNQDILCIHLQSPPHHSASLKPILTMAQTSACNSTLKSSSSKATKPPVKWFFSDTNGTQVCKGRKDGRVWLAQGHGHWREDKHYDCRPTHNIIDIIDLLLYGFSWAVDGSCPPSKHHFKEHVPCLDAMIYN